MHISAPGTNEFHIEVGKGSGKSVMSAVMLAYAITELASMDDPHRFFGLEAGKPIVCLNISVSERQAKLTVFAKLKSYIRKIKMLQGRYTFTSDTIDIDKGNILAISGHSRAEGMEGHDVYCAILDEANKHRDSSGKSNAETLFEMLQSSAASRFPAYYRVGTVSSSRSVDDYQRRTIEEIAMMGKPIPWKTEATT